MQIGDLNFGAGRPLDFSSFPNQPESQAQAEAESSHVLTSSSAPNPALQAALTTPVQQKITIGHPIYRFKLSTAKKQQIQNVDPEGVASITSWFNLALVHAKQGDDAGLCWFIKKCLSGENDSVGYLKPLNAFFHIISLPQDFFKKFTLDELIQMSEWLRGIYRLLFK